MLSTKKPTICGIKTVNIADKFSRRKKNNANLMTVWMHFEVLPYLPRFGGKFNVKI